MFRRIRNRRRARLTLEQNWTANQAFRLLAEGKPGEAAAIFAQLAQQMEANHAPRRAANLHAQAAHAFVDNQDAAPALLQSRAAVNLFLQSQMPRRATQFYANILQKLQERGMHSTAQKLQVEFGSRIGFLPTWENPPAVPASRRLPTTCPQYGGPIQREAIDWVDDYTIECAYCSALIQSG